VITVLAHLDTYVSSTTTKQFKKKSFGKNLAFLMLIEAGLLPRNLPSHLFFSFVIPFHYGSGSSSGSAKAKVTVPVPVPQHCFLSILDHALSTLGYLL
jgi:hypothetical protein